MCGRFAVTTDPALLAEKIKAIDETNAAPKDPGPNYPGPNYNVAPTTTITTVVKRHSEPEDEAARRLRSMRWGLIPPWVKSTDDGAPDNKGPLLINARADKVTTSPAFRSSARADVVSSRWTVGTVATQPRRGRQEEGGEDPVLHVRRRRRAVVHGRAVDHMAAQRRPKEAPPLLSCTIITTDAAGPLAEIHDRMPLTVSAEDWDRWLDPDAPIDEGLLRGHGDLDRIEVREVSRLVNSVRNNGPELIAPAEPEPEQATLL